MDTLKFNSILAHVHNLFPCPVFAVHRCRFAGRSTKNSMDGRGRWLDNVYIERFWWTAKYECTHLQGFETLPELQVGLERFMSWYNDERIHSSLEYHVPSDVYSGAVELVR